VLGHARHDATARRRTPTRDSLNRSGRICRSNSTPGASTDAQKSNLVLAPAVTGTSLAPSSDPSRPSATTPHFHGACSKISWRHRPRCNASGMTASSWLRITWTRTHHGLVTARRVASTRVVQTVASLRPVGARNRQVGTCLRATTRRRPGVCRSQRWYPVAGGAFYRVVGLHSPEGTDR